MTDTSILVVVEENVVPGHGAEKECLKRKIIWIFILCTFVITCEWTVRI